MYVRDRRLLYDCRRESVILRDRQIQVKHTNPSYLYKHDKTIRKNTKNRVRTKVKTQKRIIYKQYTYYVKRTKQNTLNVNTLADRS